MAILTSTATTNPMDDMHRILALPWLDRYAFLAVPIFRVFLGVILIWGTFDNVTSAGRMLEFRDFLEQNGFPAPLFSARLSAWAQFLCGAAFIAGFATRPAALVMTVNFVVALVMVHAGLPFSANISPLAMLFGSLLLLLNGPGRFSVDHRMAAVPARA